MQNARNGPESNSSRRKYLSGGVTIVSEIITKLVRWEFSPVTFWSKIRGFPKGWFPKGWFCRMFLKLPFMIIHPPETPAETAEKCTFLGRKRVVSKRVVLADVPPEQGYIRMFPRNENWNEGTFACSTGTKAGTRAHSPKPPFYVTALLSPGLKLPN